MAGPGRYIGVSPARPRVAFFEFASCEGCQLQILNNEATLLDFLDLVEIVNFREAMTGRSDDYDIAFIEGSICRRDEEVRLRDIRSNAKTLVAFGTCACFGGVNRLRERFEDQGWVKRKVYGKAKVVAGRVRPVEDIVKVDLKIFGCPVRKEEVEKIVTNIVLGKSVSHPGYPVCMECKAHGNVCVFDVGEPCLGPVTRAGCDAWCPDGGLGCWGCRGPAEEANVAQMFEIMRGKGFSMEAVIDRFECFGGFRQFMKPSKTQKVAMRSR